MFFLGTVRDDCLQQMATGFHSGPQGPWQKGIGLKVTIVQSNRTLGKVFALQVAEPGLIPSIS